MDDLKFDAHSVMMDDGTCTVPGKQLLIEEEWTQAMLRMIRAAFPGSKPSSIRICDLGSYEGGFCIEFGRLGYDCLGVDARQSNTDLANRLWERTGRLPNVRFVKDDVRNLSAHGTFDVLLCLGLLYHLDNPVDFLRNISLSNSKLLIVRTHYSEPTGTRLRGGFHRLIRGKEAYHYRSLSPLTTHEGLPGRWFKEPYADDDLSRGSSWKNKQSFWLTKDSVAEAIHRAGYSVVCEQLDGLGNIALSQERAIKQWAVYIGIK